MKKIGRNDPCWCGSNKKYKKCHLIREDEPAHPLNRIFSEFRLKSFHKECLHPDAGASVCSRKIVDAHSIQKSGPIKMIMDDGSHVYKFGQDKFGTDEISRIGWQQASTFKGFCGKHDNEFFSPIEDEPFIGTDRQCFIAGYRAYALEYFKKVKIMKGLPFLRDNVDRGMTPKHQVAQQRDIFIMNEGFIRGASDFKKTLDECIEYFKLGAYDNFRSAVFRFTGDLEIVVGGCFTPEFTIDGQRLQTLSPEAPFIENIAVNTLLTDTGFAIVFSWPSKFQKCTAFIESLTVVNHDLVPSMLIELLFSYIENIYFSKPWLDKLSEDKLRGIEAMARKSIQYGSPVRFTTNGYTNWKVDQFILR